MADHPWTTPDVREPDGVDDPAISDPADAAR